MGIHRPEIRRLSPVGRPDHLRQWARHLGSHILDGQHLVRGYLAPDHRDLRRRTTPALWLWRVGFARDAGRWLALLLEEARRIPQSPFRLGRAGRPGRELLGVRYIRRSPQIVMWMADTVPSG